MPAVTILTPCYNQARWLTEAGESVFAQTDPDWEWIVIDDGSSDDTAEAAGRFVARDPGRVRLIRQENQGQARARQAGLDMTTGEWLVMLDADDLLAPAMLATARAALAHSVPGRDPRLDAVVGHAEVVAEDGRTHLAWHRHRARPGWPALLWSNPYGMPFCLMTRLETVRRLGGLALPGVAGCEDWDLWARLARCGRRLRLVDAVFGRYRRTGANYTRQAERMLQAELDVLARAAAFDPRLVGIPDAAPAIPEALHARLANARVLHAAAGALARGAAPEVIGRLLTQLRPGGLDRRRTQDLWIEGLHAGRRDAPETGHQNPADIEAVQTALASALRDRGLVQRPEAWAARLIGLARQTHPRRSAAARWPARVSELAYLLGYR